MPALIVLLLVFLAVVLILLPIWTIIKIKGQATQTESLRQQLAAMGEDLKALRAAPRSLPAAAPAPATPPAATPAVVTPPVTPSAPVPAQPAVVMATPAVSVAAPPPPPIATLAEPPLLPPVIAAPSVLTPPPRYTPPPPKPGWLESINWEQFMGAKLFAWLGGLALLLGVAFFVKYSFDHELIPPAVRVALGFLLGAGLIVGGIKLIGRGYTTPAQTLVASGIVSLYVVTFACNSVYHFAFFGLVPTFLLMTLITATAFTLAVRLEAQVVAILGLLGGFLTPVLLSTGQDNPGGLFGYLALLDLGLAAVALHRRWFYLVPLGAGGTVVMMAAWAQKFYAPEKTVTAMTVCLVFCALFLAVHEAARRLQRESSHLVRSAAALPFVAFCFAWFFLGYRDAASHTALFFGFVVLVSFCAFILAWRESAGGLVVAAAGGTVLLMVRWAALTFTADQAPVVVTVCLFFCALYFIVYLVARWLDSTSPAILWSAVGLPAVALAFALFLMGYDPVGARPGLLFGFIVLADAVLLALAWLDDRLPRLHLVAGLTVFALLSVWTSQHLTDGLLGWALAAYLLFAVLHTAFPLLLERHRPAAVPTWWSQLFPPLSLLLMLLPIYKLDAVSLLIWPAILLVDLIAIGLAVLSASLAGVATVLVLTLLATGLCLFKVPVAIVFAPSLLFVIGGFAIFFFAASLWLVGRLGDRLPAAGGTGRLAGVFGDARAQIPAFASLLPFVLLIMVSARLAVPDPSALFGLALLLVILTLGLARLMLIAWLPACALVGVGALEYAWQARHFSTETAAVPLFWYFGFYAIFCAYPFAFQRKFVATTGPWAVAALSGVVHFPLVYRVIERSSPNDFMGLLPAMFAVPPLISLVALLKTVPADQPKRLNQLAWFGGVALFFITLVFPIQFERQWLTVAWALEGAALLWLFHRVPHPGLRAVGTVLLGTAFARLALNPAVLGYHVRGDTAIFNWYLYAYGLATVALFTGARLLAPPRERVLGVNTPPLFNTLGVILAFLLLNIEIADYFTSPGAAALAFKFSGNFARDMSYTIGWALFALGLLGAGIWQRQRFARYAAIGLLSVALLKLFLHDLARLEALYRIGTLFAVAVVAILTSFAYQRFLPSNEKTPPPAP